MPFDQTQQYCGKPLRSALIYIVSLDNIPSSAIINRHKGTENTPRPELATVTAVYLPEASCLSELEVCPARAHKALRSPKVDVLISELLCLQKVLFVSFSVLEISVPPRLVYVDSHSSQRTVNRATSLSADIVFCSGESSGSANRL